MRKQTLRVGGCAQQEILKWLLKYVTMLEMKMNGSTIIINE